MTRQPLSWQPSRPLALVLVVGITLRIVDFLNRPSLGLDEARLALNVASRSYLQLLAPLDYDQSAPLLFLWIEKLVTNALGVSDWALRAVPLLAGLGVLLLAYPVFRRVLSHAGAVFATALIGCLPVVVYYSIGVKQYGVELLVALLLVYWSLEWVVTYERQETSWPLLLGGVVAVWVSASAVFVLTAMAMALAWQATRSDNRQRQRFTVVAATAWLLSFAGAYVVTYRQARQNTYLRHYWQSAFLRVDRGFSVSRMAELAKETIWGVVIGYPGTPGWSGVTAAIVVLTVGSGVALVIGSWRVARQHGIPAAIIVAGPLVMTIGASLLGLYPVVLRLLLFSLPLVQLLVIAGLEEAARRLPLQVYRVAWRASAVAVILPLVAIAFLEATSLNPPEHLRVLVQDLGHRRRPGEPVYIFAGSIPLWAYYSTDWRAPDRDRLAFLARIASAGGVAFENAPGRRHSVEGEGRTAIYRTPLGLEIYGVPTGIEWRPIGGVTKRTPDAGWAQHEAVRIRAAADSSVWIVMSHIVGTEMELVTELKMRGARCAYERQGNDSYLARYTFAGCGGNSGCPGAERHTSGAMAAVMMPRWKSC